MDSELARFAHAKIINRDDLKIMIDRDIVSVQWDAFDLQASSIESQFGPCQDEFFDSAREMFPLVKSAIEGEFTLVGRDFGGAVAIILGAMLIKAWRPPLRLVTFNAPKVGGPELKKFYVGIPVTQYRDENAFELLSDIYEHLRNPIGLEPA